MNEKKTEISLNIEKSKDPEIRDKYNTVFIFFGLIGVVQFLPATFFTTANDFWMYKFRDTSMAEADPNHRTTLEVEFSPCVTIFSIGGTVTFSCLALFFGEKINFKLRLFGSLLVVFIFYIIAAILINVDTDSWQIAYFVFTMVVIVGINGMGALFGMTFYTIIAKFPKSYLGPFLYGQSISGICTAILQVLSLAIGISTINSAQLYFWTAIGIIIFCWVYMFLLHKYNNFFIYYNSIELPQKEGKNKNISFADIVSIVKLIWKCLLIGLFFICTMGLTHPSVTSLVVSEGHGNGDWNDVYFVPVITFLLVSTMDFAGRQLPFIFKSLRKIDPIWYAAFSALRFFVFAPLIMLCNAQPRHHLPVIFPHDYQYILIMIASSLSSGFVACIGQMLIQEIVPKEKLEDAYKVNLLMIGFVMAASAFLGIVSVDII